MPKLVGGRYELLERVGAGGQGDVWRAHDRQHQRTVALKVRRLGRDTDRESLLREARLLLQLKPHPGLPLVREDFFEGDAYHLVMDWISGRDLARVLESDGRPGLPLETVVAYLRQVADALDHLHAHDPPIVHRDVKPANVIVDNEGEVVLVDLGISASSGDALGQAAGTPAFRDPSVVSASGPTPAADVFGLAATAFALLVGTPPAPGPRPTLHGVPSAHVGRVWRALDAGLAYDPQRRPVSAGDFMAVLEPAATATNIPAQTSAFVGRERDLTVVMDALARSRVVTVTGAGGLGKTRLALEAAARMGPAYGDGVWLTELAPLRSGSSVAGAVASLFGVDELRGRSITEGVLDELGDRHVLLLLDNCEHVIEPCRELVGEIVRRCPAVDVLATSRQALGTEFEESVDVLPLTLPAEDDAEPKALARSEAVRLFLDRAATARPGFRISATTGPLVARICHRLDGVPLAIELAAARANRLDIADIASRLEESLSVLRTDGRSAPRHQTLRATFDWSYALLSPEEQRSFTWLSVFSGGFTADMAAVVTRADNVARTVSDLVAKSLLVARTDEPGGTRYSMLETTRAYALERLGERAEVGSARDRALHWALGFAGDAAAELAGPSRAASLARLDAEHENLRESLSHAVDTGRDEALALAAVLAEFWAVRGPWSDGRRYLDDALSRDGGDSAIRAKACAGAGDLAFLEADYQVARERHGEALSLLRAVSDERGIARSLASLGQVAEARTDFETARELYGQSLATYRELGDADGVAELLTKLGSVAEYLGDYETAQALLEQSLSDHRALGDDRGIATALLNLGYVMSYRGDGRGRPVLEESLALFRKAGDRYGASRALNLLAIRSWFEGDGDQARSLGEEALRLRRDIGDRLGIAVSLESLAGLEAFRGHGLYAGRLFGAAARLREVIGSPVTPSDRPLMDWAVSDARRAVGDDAYDVAWAEGHSMTAEAAITFALVEPVSVST